MDHIHTCIIGAGVVGLAVGRALARLPGDLIVLEQGGAYGEGVSARNSEVIHAGIYYPAGSLKAELCVRGKQLLYEYCASRGVGHRKIGKLIVATCAEEEAALEEVKSRAEANGVLDLAYVQPKQLQHEEPEVNATLALLSPSTGIVDVHGLMTTLLGDLEAAGGNLALNTRVASIEVKSPEIKSPGIESIEIESTETTSPKTTSTKTTNPTGAPVQLLAGSGSFIVNTEAEGNAYTFTCDRLVNVAGLGAQAVAHSIDALDPALIPPLHYCKGNYFLMSGKCPFNHLIYPVPDPTGAGLGIHATIDMAGQVRFGPDVEYTDEESYEVSDSRMGPAEAAIRRYFPGLPDAALRPGYAGIRPKLQGPGEPFADFVIQDETTHGLPGLVQLFGIESPGLTSCLAIAETVAARF